MKPLIINGWQIYIHPLCAQQIADLEKQVESLRRKKPDEWKQSNSAKRLAAVTRLITEIIPQDPKREEYRQGNTMGKPYSHWRRAKFFQQYRLFFRFNEALKVIVFAWVNDTSTKRAYGSKTDAYKVFARMLESGHPPDDWEALAIESHPFEYDSGGSSTKRDLHEGQESFRVSAASGHVTRD